jgi:hypothetical protein
MRPRYALLLVAVVVVAGGFVAAQDRAATANERSEQAKIRYGRAMEANQELLDSLPLLDGVRFMNFTEIGGPPGGAGYDWITWYSTDDSENAEAAVARYAEALESWPEFAGDARHASARDGEKRVVVTAGQYGEKKRWGFSVTLNALDAALYPAPR